MRTNITRWTKERGEYMEETTTAETLTGYTACGMFFSVNLTRLYDAFDEAARALSKPSTELYRAWKAGDFRRFIPSAYNTEYLDFLRYPLKYDI